MLAAFAPIWALTAVGFLVGLSRALGPAAVDVLGRFVFTVAMPYMLSSDQANWRGKAGFLFGGISVVCLVWCWARLPESRGRTFEELDILFERKVPARRFREYDLLAERGSEGGGDV